MQAVADAHFLKVAKPGVEGDERLVRRLAVSGAFLQQAALSSTLQNEGRDRAGAARIETLRLSEFIEQLFELQRRPMRTQRRSMAG